MNQPACHSTTDTSAPHPRPRNAKRRDACAGLLCRGIITRRVLATTALAAITSAACTCLAGSMPRSALRTENIATLIREPDGDVTPDLAMACFSVLEASVRAWKTPANASFSPEILGSVRGASIILRLEGQIVGRGTVLKTGIMDPSQEHPLVTAAKTAMGEAASKLPGDRDALRDERVKALAAQIQISLEVCGEPTPFTPLAFDVVDMDLKPGLDGVAVRMGDHVESLFPATMLIRDQSPGDALAACIGLAASNPTLGIRTNPMTQPPAVAKSHEAVFYHFRPWHVAQTAPAAPAKFLHRGSKVFAPRDLTMASLSAWGDAMAKRLVATSDIEPLDQTDPPHPDAKDRICLYLPGTIRFAEGKTESARASLRQQTLVALALDRYAAIVSGTPSDSASNGGIRLLRDVLEHVPSKAPSVETDEDAISKDIAYQTMLARLSYEQSFRPWHGKPGVSVVSRWDPVLDINRIAAVDEQSPARKLSISSRAKLAYALALRKDARAEDHIKDVFRSASAGNLQDAMPWIGLADLTQATQAGRAPAAALLREWREQIYARMIPPAAAGDDDADLAGGLAPGIGKPPTAESARSVIFIARMLREPLLTDDAEKGKEISRLLAALRFLRQLTIDENSAYAASDLPATLWAVRRTAWDQRLDPEDSAMTLMAVCEAIDSLRGPQKRVGGQGQDGSVGK